MTPEPASKPPGDHPTPACCKGMGEISGVHEGRMAESHGKALAERSAHAARLGGANQSGGYSDPDENV